MKRVWDLAIERTKARVEIKKQDSVVKLEEVKANASTNKEIVKVKDDQVEFYKNQMIKLEGILKSKSNHVKELLLQIKILEKEKDDLQTQLINLKEQS